MQSLVEVGPVVLDSGEEDSSYYIRYFVIISPWKREWSFICTNLNPYHLLMPCAKFC